MIILLMIILLSMAGPRLSFECLAYSHEGLAIPMRALLFPGGPCVSARALE